MQQNDIIKTMTMLHMTQVQYNHKSYAIKECCEKIKLKCMSLIQTKTQYQKLIKKTATTKTKCQKNIEKKKKKTARF